MGSLPLLSALLGDYMEFWMIKGLPKSNVIKLRYLKRDLHVGAGLNDL